MRDDLRVRIFDGRENALGHRGALEIHVGVDGNKHDVELREDFVVQIEFAVFQNVHFAAGEDADAADALLRRRESS